MAFGRRLHTRSATTYVAPMPTTGAQTTLGDLQQATPWVLLYC